jgi:dTDP-4-dehydrorhamnose reductase
LAFSSDLVFDGKRSVPYVEGDAASPRSVYGAAQAEAERQVLDVLPDTFVVRTSALFGPAHPDNELARALRELTHERPISAHTMHFSPTYAPHLVHSVLDLLIDGASQIWHLTNGGSESFAELLRRIAIRAKLSLELVREDAQTATKPLRSGYNLLASKHGAFLPSLDEALDRYLADIPTLPEGARGYAA